MQEQNGTIRTDQIGIKYKPQDDNQIWNGILARENDSRVQALKNFRDVFYIALKGDANIKGWKIDDNGELIQHEIRMQDSGLSMDNLLSGHAGRTYFSMPEGMPNHLMEYLRHNNTGALNSRFAATHAAIIKDGVLSEVKLSFIAAAWSGLKGFIFGGDSKTHFGIDVPIPNPNAPNGISTGHLYINAINDIGQGKSAFGVGLEGSPPGGHNEITGGAHSLVGAADKFTAFGGPKCYIKANINDANFIEYLNSFTNSELSGVADKTDAEKLEFQKQIKDAINATKSEVNKDFKDSQRGFSSKSIEIPGTNNKIHLVRSGDGDKNVYVVTEYALKMMKDGNTIQRYYDGLSISIDYDKDKEFCKTIASKSPEFANQLIQHYSEKSGESKLVTFCKEFANEPTTTISPEDKENILRNSKVLEEFKIPFKDLGFFQKIASFFGKEYSGINGVNADGKTPLEVAKENGQSEIFCKAYKVEVSMEKTKSLSKSSSSNSLSSLSTKDSLSDEIVDNKSLDTGKNAEKVFLEHKDAIDQQVQKISDILGPNEVVNESIGIGSKRTHDLIEVQDSKGKINDIIENHDKHDEGKERIADRVKRTKSSGSEIGIGS